MEVILKEDVPNLGNMGEVVTVKPGYGRNYLIPKGLAVLATRGKKAEFDHLLRDIEARREALKADAMTLGDKIDELPITVAKKAGDDDRLFGSVTNRDIEASLAALGHTVNRRRIILKEPIKSLGIYAVPVKLHADVTSHLKVWVCAL